MSTVFEPGAINGMILKNRFVCSAIWDGMAEKDGSCSQKVVDLVARPARGNVGLIITGAAFVSSDGHTYLGMAGIHDDSLLPGLTAMTQAVHEAGGRIIAQLFHGGVFANPESTGQDALGPFTLNTDNGPGEGDDNRTDPKRGGGFRRSRDPSQEGRIRRGPDPRCSRLSAEPVSLPVLQPPEDAYGGSLENRARLLLEVVRAVREAVGDGFPVLVKINAEDFLPGGFSAEDMLQVAAWLERAGVDAIELSGGTVLGLLSGNPNTSFSRVERNGPYYEDAAKRYRERISVPLILDGGTRSLRGVRAADRPGDRRLRCHGSSVHQGAGPDPALGVRGYNRIRLSVR